MSGGTSKTLIKAMLRLIFLKRTRKKPNADEKLTLDRYDRNQRPQHRITLSPICTSRDRHVYSLINEIDWLEWNQINSLTYTISKIIFNLNAKVREASITLTS